MPAVLRGAGVLASEGGSGPVHCGRYKAKSMSKAPSHDCRYCPKALCRCWTFSAAARSTGGGLALLKWWTGKLALFTALLDQTLRKCKILPACKQTFTRIFTRTVTRTKSHKEK